MGAFVAVFGRDGAPVGSSLVERLLAPLSHRGPDGSSSWVSGPFGLGSQAFWTTPEEVGERQPVIDNARRLAVLFDGRLDNRDELLATLNIDPHAQGPISDASLTLRAFERWGADCFARFLGPFAACLVDLVARQVTLARDHLGDRTVFYNLGDDLLVVGSEEVGILAHAAVPRELDESTVARHFAIRPPLPGRTFYTGIREVLPAETIVVGPTEKVHATYWSPPEERPVCRRTDEDHVQEYRHLLTQSVRSRLRVPGEPAALLSGGLDSTSVAALAAADPTRPGFPRPLRTISWVFDELRACDERRWIDAMVSHCGFDSIRFAGDGCWPMRDFATWGHSANGPDVNAFRLLKNRAYSLASANGHHVVLVGASGDDVYSRWNEAFVDMVRALRLGTLGRELALAFRAYGLSGLRRHPAVRGLGRRAMEMLRGRRQRPERLDSRVAPWLTPAAARLVRNPKGQEPTDPRSRSGVHPGVSYDTAWGVSREIPHAARCGVELRDPFRDRRIVEFALRVPHHLLFRHGREKHLVRAAMGEALPQAVRLRSVYTPLGGLFRRGEADREAGTLRSLLGREAAVWPRYVEEGPVRQGLDKPPARSDDGAEGLVLWYCATFERWTDSRNRGEEDVPGANWQP